MSGHGEKRFLAWNGEIGPFLEEARQRRGLSLKEAERSTRIRSRYLEGLERENPKVLPGRAYVQGFLRSYAEFLGLDVEELSRRFKRHHGERRPPGEEREETAKSPEPRPGRRGALATLFVAMLTLTLVLAAFYLLRGGTLPFQDVSSGPGAPVERPAGGAEPDGPARTEEPAPTLAESPPEKGEGGGRLRATVLVRGAESWISVETESGVEYTGIAQPGFSRSFESGEFVRIITGNAGAVELRLNGLEYGSMGESGEVTSQSFTLKSER